MVHITHGHRGGSASAITSYPTSLLPRPGYDWQGRLHLRYRDILLGLCGYHLSVHQVSRNIQEITDSSDRVLVRWRCVALISESYRVDRLLWRRLLRSVAGCGISSTFLDLLCRCDIS